MAARGLPPPGPYVEASSRTATPEEASRRERESSLSLMTRLRIGIPMPHELVGLWKSLENPEGLADLYEVVDSSTWTPDGGLYNSEREMTRVLEPAAKHKA